MKPLAAVASGLRRIDERCRDDLRLAFAVQRLRRQDWSVDFPAEGNVRIRLPAVGRAAPFGSHRDLARKCTAFATRPTKELLPRGVVHALFTEGHLRRDLSIVDIGAWIGDNALVWANELVDPATVIAIDPSAGNVDFIRRVADLNSIRNLDAVVAACSESVGEQLYFHGSLEHTWFSSSGPMGNAVQSSTIDAVVDSLGDPPIGLLHVDVEGFERKVLSGARATIVRSRPMVLFEHHLRDSEGLAGLLEFLCNAQYQVGMVNEVLPGCSLDCRNLLAVPAERAEVFVSLNDISELRNSNHFPATPGLAIVSL